MSDPNVPLSVIMWVLEHLHIPAIVYGIWKTSRFFSLIEGRALQAEQHITKMATNCFPTMQTSLQNQDGLLKSMDGSLKTIATQTKRTAAKVAKVRTAKKK